MQNCTFRIRITNLYGSQTSPVDLWMQNNVLRSRMMLVYCWKPSSVILCIQRAPLASVFLVSIGPALICGFCMQNSDFRTRITSLYWSKTSPVDLWMQNNVLRTRMTLVYWCKPSSVILCIPKSGFSISISSLYRSCPHLCLLHAKQRL